MRKAIHWVDLDETIWRTNAKWWIVDKRNPSTYLMRITQYDAQLILNGKYMQDGQEINYNGMTGWLSNELITKIKQKRAIDLKDIGISFREYQDEKLIINQTKDMFIFIDRISLIKKSTDTVNLLTARSNARAHIQLVEILKKELKEHGLNINKSMFVNDPLVMNSYGSTSDKKLIVIIESIIGYQVKDNTFTPIMCDHYDDCHFYDDEDLNISACEGINARISTLLNNTQPWLKQRVVERINLAEKKLILNHVTTNELNPFTTQVIDIKMHS